MDWMGDKLVHGVWCSICWFFLAGCAKGGVGPVLTRAVGGLQFVSIMSNDRHDKKMITRTA